MTSSYEPPSAAPALMAFTRSSAHAAGSFACRPCDAFVTSLRAVARRCLALLVRRFAFFGGWLGASSRCEEARSSFFVMLGGTVASPQLDPCVAASMRHRTEVHGATVVVVVEEMGVVDVVGRVLEDTRPSVVLVVDVWRSVVLVGLVVVVVGESALQTATPCRP